jgi:hypothetical protein
MAAVEGTQPLGKAYVIGIISGFLPYAGGVSNDTGERGNLVQNSGLAVCVSSECIQEAIEDDLEKRSII